MRRNIGNLQALRGAAAVLVLIYHLGPTLARPAFSTVDLRFGMIGVDIFFVLSGFVMFYARAGSDSNWRVFLANRFVRIVPLYWMATASLGILFLSGFRPVGLHQLTPAILLQSLFFIQSNFPGGRHDLIVTVGWTLIYELFFYLSFAATFPLRSLERSFIVLAGAFGVLILLARLTPGAPYALTYLGAPIILEFLAGAALALLWIRHADRLSGGFVGVGAALIGVGVLLVAFSAVRGGSSPTKEGARWIVFGGPATLIVAGALVLERAGRAVTARPVLLLGAVSYALYLFHQLILQAGEKLLQHSSMNLPAPLEALLLAAAAILVAISIHLAIEKPVLRWGRGLARRRLPGVRAPQLAPAMIP